MRALKKATAAGVATAACFAALGTGSALASTMTLSSGALSYTGAPSEANHVTFSFDPMRGVIVIEDTGAASISFASSPNKQLCQSDGPQTVYCNWLSVASITAHLGNGGSFAESKLTFTATSFYAGSGNDTLIGGGGPTTLVAGAGSDTLTAGSGATHLVGGSGTTVMTGGAGHNVYQGGSGTDTITSRNGVTEDVTCGGGTDSVTADTADTVNADCEGIARGVGQPPAGTATGDQPGADQADVALNVPVPAIAPHPVAVTNGNVIPIEISCPAAAIAGCQGTIALDLAQQSGARGKVTAARRVKRGKRISRPRSFRVAAGHKAVVRVSLSRRGVRKFKRSRKSLKVLVTVATRSEAGTHKSTRTIEVRAARRSRGSMKARGRKR